MPSKSSALILGLSILLGLAALGALLGQSALRFKEYERTVSVKGLSERETPADIVLWPIQFTAADNDLSKLYEKLDRDTARITAFLAAHEIEPGEVTVSTPQVASSSAIRPTTPARWITNGQWLHAKTTRVPNSPFTLASE